MSPDFWRGRRVFVTGHTGFKGSWLVMWLRELGAQVTGYALPPPTLPNLYEAAGVGAGIEDIRGDVRDYPGLSEAVSRARPEVVVHMAARSLVREAYREPLQAYATNVMGTAHVLEAARAAPSTRSVVVVTTDKCYVNHERSEGYREDERLGGLDPYSSSKACAELVTAAYRASYFDGGPGAGRAAVASARAGNVIGGGDWASERLVPDAMRSFASQQPLRLRNPDSIRPWQHVLDPLAGYLVLAERLFTEGAVFAEAWNFGPAQGAPVTNAELADRLAALWGPGARWEKDSQPGPRESARLALDSAKARSRLNWQPRLPLSAAAEWTVEWYRAFNRGADVARVARDQMARYRACHA